MPLEYRNLDTEQQNRIRNDITGADPEPDYASFLPAWEAEHFSHSVLLEKATAEGDEDAASAAREAMATLETSVNNVRAGLRPDGTTPSAPPAPAPTDPTPPPADPTPPAPAGP